MCTVYGRKLSSCAAVPLARLLARVACELAADQMQVVGADARKESTMPPCQPAKPVPALDRRAQARRPARAVICDIVTHCTTRSVSAISAASA